MPKFVSILLGLVMAMGLACNHSPQSYLDKGESFRVAGKLEDAVLNYRKAVQRDPKFGPAYYKLGGAYLEAGDLEAADHALSTAVQLMPDSLAAKTALADLCLKAYLVDPNRSGRFYNRVRVLSDQLLRRDPNSVEGLRFKGYLAMSDRRVSEAIEIFQKANTIKPLQPDVVLPLAQALIENKQYEESERLALELIRVDKSFGPIYSVLYRLYVATNRPADAERVLEQRIANNPSDAAGILELAGHYEFANKPTEMSRTLQRLLDNSKYFPQGPLQAGNFYMRTGHPVEAQRAFELGSRMDPDALVYRKAIANALLAQGKTEEAAKIVAAILQHYPDDEESQKTNALILLESVNPDVKQRGISELGKLLARYPNDHRLRLALGRAHLSAGEMDAARYDFEELLRRGGEPIQARLYLAEIGLNKHQTEDALRYADEVLAVEPSNPRGKFLRATSLIGLGRYGSARSELEALLESNPGYQEAQLQLGFLELAQKRFKDAEESFHKIYQPGQGQVQVLQGLVEVRLAQRQFDDALAVLENELQAAPNFSGVRDLLAATAGRVGKYDLAIQQYQLLLAANPKSAELCEHLAQMQRFNGNMDDAAGTMERAMQLDSTNAAGHVFLADLERDIGRRARAKAEYERALSLEPENPIALNNLAFLLIEDGGNVNQALRLAQRAVQKDPNQPVFTDTLGMAYLRSSMNPTALEIFKGLIKSAPDNPTYRFHLALTLLNMGDKSGARTELQTALAKKPDINHEHIQELLARLGDR